MIWPFLMIYASEKLTPTACSGDQLDEHQCAFGVDRRIHCWSVDRPTGKEMDHGFWSGIEWTGLILVESGRRFSDLCNTDGLQRSRQPLYRVGSDAMLADLIPEEKRVDAYALIRLSNNLGIALGPTIGGFLATRSYTFAFLGATTGMITYSLLFSLLAKETLPTVKNDAKIKIRPEGFGGYLSISRDLPFISFVIAFTLVTCCAVLIWVLLSVYAKQNFGIPESQYGWIATTNAVLVVLLQMPVTSVSKRYQNLSVIIVGAIFYTLAVTSIAFGNGFWWFWGSMVVMTFGEMLLKPTSSTFVANLAPTDKRGRYMSIYGLSWGVAAGTAPLLGGFLNDIFGPRTIWFGGGMVGLIGILGFIFLPTRQRER